MYIKRGAFLLLTAAIAQQACTIVKEKDDDEGNAGKAGSASSGGSNNQAGAGGDSSAGSSGDSGAGGEAEAGASGEAGEGGEGGDSACDDSQGTPGDCSKLEEIENCAGGFEKAYCDSAITNLKPKVAEAAVACMLEFTDCNTDNAYTCVKDALAEACPDEAKSEFCTSAVEKCGAGDAITAEECHAMVDGLNDTGLAAVKTCADEGCEFGLWSCIEGL